MRHSAHAPELLFVALSVAFGVGTVLFLILNEQNAPRLARVALLAGCDQGARATCD